MIGGSFINELPSSIFQGSVSCQKQGICTQNTNHQLYHQRQDYGKQFCGELWMTCFIAGSNIPWSLRNPKVENGFQGGALTSITYVGSQTINLNMCSTNS